MPPGNTCFPLIGETFFFMKPHSPTKHREFMEDHISRYGKIFSTHLFGKRSIVSADPELNRFVLMREGKLFQHGFSLAFQKLVGPNALILMQGEVHKHMRSTVLGFVNGTRRIREVFLQDADQIACRIISSWEEGHVISAKAEATKFTLYIMVKKILSMTQENPEIEKLAREYESFTGGLGANPLYMHFAGSLHWKALQSSFDTNVNNSFMPFGGGLWLCPGAELAKMEMSDFLHHLILKYDWEPVELDNPMVVRFIEISKGLPIKVRPISTNL